MNRYPPKLPTPRPAELNYHARHRPDVRRRPHPVLFPIILVIFGLALAISLYYGIPFILHLLSWMPPQP